MLKALFTAALSGAALLAATPALADEARTFTRDGETFTYTTAVKANRLVIAGRSVTSGNPFQLTVRGARVTGYVNGQAVAFTMPQRRPGTVEVAAR